MKLRAMLAASLAFLIAAAASAQTPRDLKVKKDKQQLANNDAWVYNDYAKAAAAAKSANKPLLVVFR